MSPFTAKDWKDYPDTTTPINAAALEDMETRLSDYTDAGGGGGGGGQATAATGDFLVPFFAQVASVAIVAGSIWYTWQPVPRTMTINQLAVYVSTAAGGSTVRLGMYENTAGRPAALIVDGGTVDTSSTGAKTITISEAVSPPGFWTAYLAAGGNPTVDSIANGVTLGVAFGNYYGTYGYQNGFYRAHTGALPDPAVIDAANPSSAPIVYGRVA